MGRVAAPIARSATAAMFAGRDRTHVGPTLIREGIIATLSEIGSPASWRWPDLADSDDWKYRFDRRRLTQLLTVMASNKRRTNRMERKNST